MILWIALLIAIGVGLWKLAGAFPGAISSDFDRVSLVTLFAILAFVSSSLIFASRINLRAIVRNVSIWAGVFAVLVLGFAFRDDLENIALRIRSELIPGYAVATDSNTLVLSESSDGHFYAVSQVNGTPVRFLIDTGASDIVLSPSDAERLGIDTKNLNFSRPYQTANGVGRGAPFTVESLSIGPYQLADVPVSINQSAMNESLLGMSFLRRLASFEIRGHQLFLHWR